MKIRVILAVAVILSYPITGLAESVRETTRRRVDILVNAPEQSGSACRVRVRVTYDVANTTEQPRQVRQQFPVLTQPWRPPSPAGFRIHLNDKPVEFTVDRVDFAPGATDGGAERATRKPDTRPAKEQQVAWLRLLDEWTQRDPELRKLMSRYHELSNVRESLTKLTREFETAVSKHLIDARLRYDALKVVNGRGSIGDLIALMPEVDQSLRYDIEFRQSKYVSYLDGFDPESYRAHEAKWQRQVNDWFQSKRELVVLIPPLRRAWDSHHKAEELLNNEIVKLLHDQCGLSLEHALAVRDHYSSPTYFRPSMTSVLKKLFPEVRRERKSFEAEFARRMNRWNFDGLVVSTVNGELEPVSIEQNHERIGLRADSVRVTAAIRRDLLNQDSSASPPDRYWRFAGWPHLLTFNVPLKAKSKSTVVIEYDVSVDLLEHPSNSKGRGMGLSQLISILDPAARAVGVDVSVSLPRGLHPILSPAPESVSNEQDERRVFKMHLETPQQNVHLALVDFRSTHGVDTFLYPFVPDQQTLEFIGGLQAKTDNPTIAPLLLVARYRVLLSLGRQLKAHRAFLQLTKSHSDFTGLAILLKDNEFARSAEQLHSWIEQKSRSPQFESDDDFNRFAATGSDRYVLTADELAELAMNVQTLTDSDLSLEERMGRRFVLCQAGIESRENLVALLKLAASDEAGGLPALRLIKALTIEKADALPFVLQHAVAAKQEMQQQLADAKKKQTRVSVSDPAWQEQYVKYTTGFHALGTFRSPRAAVRLIEFVRSTNDGLLIDSALTALDRMTLPELFDALADLSDQVSPWTESALRKYQNLLIRSNPVKASAVVARLHDKYPNMRPPVRMKLPVAIETYNTSNDKEKLSAAIQSLMSHGKPMVIAQLTYRRGLKQWMNKVLVSLVLRGDDHQDAFPFVEQFYLEFVKGRTTPSHYECIDAFIALRDHRAIPHLKEMVRTKDYKPTAAIAIGTLLLDRRGTKRKHDPARSALVQLVDKVNHLQLSTLERGRVLKGLLEYPVPAMQVIMSRGRVSDLLAGTSPSSWRADDTDRLKYLSRFGNVATRQLLKASRGSSLKTRYNLSQLLNLLPRESHELLRESASNVSTDLDQRRTAILALGKIRDRESVPLLEGLLNDKVLRGSVIDALANIGTDNAINAIRKLKQTLETAGHADLRQEVWISKIEAGLSNTRD